MSESIGFRKSSHKYIKLQSRCHVWGNLIRPVSLDKLGTPYRPSTPKISYSGIFWSW